MKINKNQIKLFASLKDKKERVAHKLYIAEGEKIVNELLQSNERIATIIAKAEWIEENKEKIKKEVTLLEAGANELERISNFKTPNKVVAIVNIAQSQINYSNFKDTLSLALDNIQDPGNLGTIIRIADWFGIKNIICSEQTVDVYNPKVLQSTMGAFMRVNITYTNLIDFIKWANKDSIPVYGTFLEGEDIYTSNIRDKGIIVMGNESNGISDEIKKLITQKITIPSFNKDIGSESLNVAIATGIICSEFKRRTY